jgi:hypothetical protein
VDTRHYSGDSHLLEGTKREDPGRKTWVFPSTLEVNLLTGESSVFVITKKYNGKRVSSIEHNDPFSQMRVLAGMIKEISVDPRFSIVIEVKPHTIGNNDLALDSGKIALSPETNPSTKRVH